MCGKVSTFSAERLGVKHSHPFAAWKQSLNTSIYFIPDFDETQGYYSAASGVRSILNLIFMLSYC